MQAILKTFQRRLFKLRGLEHGEIVLVQRRVFILPSGAGVLFAVVLLLTLAGSINYGLSLGYILTFLLGSFAITAMLYTFRNLAGLRVMSARAVPVFAGETAHFGMCLRNPTTAHRYAIHLTRDRHETEVVDVAPESTVIASAAVPALKRGWLRPGRLILYTRFPVGLYCAWAYIELDAQCLVYPRPAPPGLPLPPLLARPGERAGATTGADDFAGLRQYHPGDSPRHVAWKAAARDQGLFTKQFNGHGAAELWLSLDLVPDVRDIEQKLSRLTRWVLDAHAAGLAFGLKLPTTTVPMGSGESQCERCLEALALYSPERKSVSGAARRVS
ncbi:MAG: DUF58 domain-containing protein [Burkholderiales bacterium]